MIQLQLLNEAKAFLRSLPEKARKKVVYNLKRIENGEKDEELFKKLGGTEIWEARTMFNGFYYRLFAFWDPTQNHFIIATHGIVKTTDKTPQKEIAKASAIRTAYIKYKTSQRNG